MPEALSDLSAEKKADELALIDFRSLVANNKVRPRTEELQLKARARINCPAGSGCGMQVKEVPSRRRLHAQCHSVRSASGIWCGGTLFGEVQDCYLAEVDGP